jgi:hypothetical protein
MNIADPKTFEKSLAKSFLKNFGVVARSDKPADGFAIAEDHNLTSVYDRAVAATLKFTFERLAIDHAFDVAQGPSHNATVPSRL